MPLKYTIKIMVTNGQTLNVGHFVRVRATTVDLNVRLFLRVSDTPLTIVLGYPFMHKFNPLINWKHRTVQIIHNGTTNIIPVVKVYGNTNTRMSVDSADGDLQTVQNAAEPIQQLTPNPPQHVTEQKALLVKLLSDAAVLPKKNYINLAGYDLSSAEDDVVSWSSRIWFLGTEYTERYTDISSAAAADISV